MRSKNFMIASVAAAVVALAVFATVAYGVYTGLNDGSKKSQAGAIVTGSVPLAALGQGNATVDTSARSSAAAAPAVGIAQPAPGAFSPGGAPYGGPTGVSADGISAWGVAYREVSDPGAKADSALVKAAYQDAEKKAGDLATATGNRLGKLLALSDQEVNQPYFKPCTQTIPPQGAPVPQGRPSAAGGSEGASGSGTVAPNGATVAIAPAPCQANGSHYLVVWVYVRHAL